MFFTLRGTCVPQLQAQQRNTTHAQMQQFFVCVPHYFFLTRAKKTLALHCACCYITTMQTQQHIAQQIQQLLANSAATTATIAYTTQVTTAAAHKHMLVQKHTVAKVQLFANASAAANIYANAVKHSAAQFAANSAAAIAQFTAQRNYFTHTDCYSIVQHNSNSKLYLYCIYNAARSYYTINAVRASKQQVAQLLTASAAAALLQHSNTVYNATHNITHSVIVRTIALQNIQQLRAHKQCIKFN